MDPYNGVPGGNPYPFPRRDPSEFATFKYVKPVSGGVLEPTDNKGYSQNWNVTFEQQIGRDLSLSVAYVANKGTDILGALELNPAIYGPGATTGNTNSRRTYAGMSAMEIATPYQRSDYNSIPDHRDEAGLAGADDPVHLRLRHPEGQRLPDGRRGRVLPQELRESRRRLLVRGLRHPAQVQPVGGVRPPEQHVGDGRRQGPAERLAGQRDPGAAQRAAVHGQERDGPVADRGRPGQRRPHWRSHAPERRGPGPAVVQHRRRSPRRRSARSAPRSAIRCAARTRPPSTWPSSRTSRSARGRGSSSASRRSTCSTGSTTTTRTRQSRRAPTSARILGAGDPRVLQLGFKFLY